jgi:hypothetical protein
MDAEAVVVDSVTFCEEENVPPFGEIVGAAAVCPAACVL